MIQSSNVQHSDYSVYTSTHFQTNQYYTPNVLYIFLIQVFFFIHIHNLNKLSLDYNPIIFENLKTPLFLPFSTSNQLINWKII